MVFILQFANTVYHIGWFAHIENFLHLWDKSHLIMMYDTFNMLLEMIASIEDFCTCVYQWYCKFVCDIFVWFWYQGDGGGLIEWVWECSSLCSFLEQFENKRCYLCSKCLMEFSCKAIWSWDFCLLEAFSSVSVLGTGLFTPPLLPVKEPAFSFTDHRYFLWLFHLFLLWSLFLTFN